MFLKLVRNELLSDANLAASTNTQHFVAQDCEPRKDYGLATTVAFLWSTIQAGHHTHIRLHAPRQQGRRIERAPFPGNISAATCEAAFRQATAQGCESKLTWGMFLNKDVVLVPAVRRRTCDCPDTSSNIFVVVNHICCGLCRYPVLHHLLR